MDPENDVSLAVSVAFESGRNKIPILACHSQIKAYDLVLLNELFLWSRDKPSTSPGLFSSNFSQLGRHKVTKFQVQLINSPKLSVQSAVRHDYREVYFLRTLNLKIFKNLLRIR